MTEVFNTFGIWRSMDGRDPWMGSIKNECKDKNKKKGYGRNGIKGQHKEEMAVKGKVREGLGYE